MVKNRKLLHQAFIVKPCILVGKLSCLVYLYFVQGLFAALTLPGGQLSDHGGFEFTLAFEQ